MKHGERPARRSHLRSSECMHYDTAGREILGGGHSLPRFCDCIADNKGNICKLRFQTGCTLSSHCVIASLKHENVLKSSRTLNDFEFPCICNKRKKVSVMFIKFPT